MFATHIELTADLHPTWSAERLIELYRLFTTRITLASETTNTELLEAAGFFSLRLQAECAAFRVRDMESSVDVVCRLLDSGSDRSLLGRPFRGGSRVYHFYKKALIPLPQQLWSLLEEQPNNCGCPWCAGKPALLDSILVDWSSHYEPFARLTHAPALRDRTAKASLTIPVPVTTQQLESIPKLYAAMVDLYLHQRSPADFQKLELPAEGSFFCPEDARYEHERRVFLRLIREDFHPLDESTRQEMKKLTCKDGVSQTARIALPESLWMPMEAPLGNRCDCPDWHQGKTVMTNSLSVPRPPQIGSSAGRLAVAELTHTRF